MSAEQHTSGIALKAFDARAQEVTRLKHKVKQLKKQADRQKKTLSYQDQSKQALHATRDRATAEAQDLRVKLEEQLAITNGFETELASMQHDLDHVEALNTNLELELANHKTMLEALKPCLFTLEEMQAFSALFSQLVGLGEGFTWSVQLENMKRLVESKRPSGAFRPLTEEERAAID